MADTVMWGIHTGKTGDADSSFMAKRIIALSCSGTPDFSHLPANREAFKSMCRLMFDSADGNVTASASQLIRFVHEMQVGDLVAYPSRTGRKVHLGKVTGPYQYAASARGGYAHQRLVEWTAHVPRTNYSQGALCERGTSLSLFLQVKNYLDEHLAALEGRVAVVACDEDEAVGLVASEVEQTTRDNVHKSLLRELKGRPFTHFVAHMPSKMGFHTRIAPPGPDGGIDIVPHRDELGFEPQIVKVQAKGLEGSNRHSTVASPYGNIGNAEDGLSVTLGTFTKQAVAFARDTSNLRLIGSKQRVELVLQRFGQLDAKYTGILPSRSEYLPEAIEQGNGG